MTEYHHGTPEEEFSGSVLPEDGEADLSDQLMGYLTEIEVGGPPDDIAKKRDQ